MQKTDRQAEELVAFAKANRLNFDESTDIYKDIISRFKDGEDRPNFSILMTKPFQVHFCRIFPNLA